MAHDLERLKRALAGRYRVEREAGRGGMATVYLAHDLKHDRPVALKVLRPELSQALGSERFLREIALTARLDHPHILPLLDSGEADGLLYYVMPYVDGESLRERLQRERQLPLDEALRIAREVADALGHAHAMGIVHRDIKPENILLAGGHARVADFGIARAVTREAASSITETGLAVGTPAYMSPEQASGEREVDARTDVYALGSVAYEMLAGEPPFTGATAEAILARKSIEAVPSLRVVRDTVPQAVEEAITKALAKAPADRFVMASQFAEALESGRSAVGPGLLTAPGSPRRRLLPPTAATLLLVLAGAWWVTQRDPGPPPITSLAVLPLVNLMGDPEQEYFVEGMHEALTAELSKIAALRMISRTSTMRYRGTDKAMPQIARELRVEGLIEGSVLREGDEVRITVQLVHGPSDRHVWGDSYQRGLRDILALHKEVALDVARQIHLTVSPGEESRLARVDRVNPEAYEAYLRGRWHERRLSPQNLELAREHFQMTLQLDPAFAPGHAGIAAYYGASAYFGYMSEREGFSRAKEAALAALELDSTLSEAYSILALNTFFGDWDWYDAGQSFERAIALNPSDPVGREYYSYYLTAMGRFEEALAHIQRAQELDPVSPVLNFAAGMSYSKARQVAEAAEQFERAIRMDPGYFNPRLSLGVILVREGKHQEGIEQIRRAADLVAQAPFVLARLGWAYGVAGDSEAAREILRQLDQLASDTHMFTNRALIHIGMQQRDAALEFLERAYGERESWMAWMKVSPFFDPLRDDVRFQDLLRRMNFPN